MKNSLILYIKKSDLYPKKYIKKDNRRIDRWGTGNTGEDFRGRVEESQIDMRNKTDGNNKRQKQQIGSEISSLENFQFQA